MNSDKNRSQIIIYQTEDAKTKLEVRLEDETVWLTQKLMAELFQTTIANVNTHLKNLFSEGELKPEAVIKDSLITASEYRKMQTKIVNRLQNVTG